MEAQQNLLKYGMKYEAPIVSEPGEFEPLMVWVKMFMASILIQLWNTKANNILSR